MYIVYAKWNIDEWRAGSNIIEVRELPAVKPFGMDILEVPDAVYKKYRHKRNVAGQEIICNEDDAEIIGFGTPPKEDSIIIRVENGPQES